MHIFPTFKSQTFLIPPLKHLALFTQIARKLSPTLQSLDLIINFNRLDFKVRSMGEALLALRGAAQFAVRVRAPKHNFVLFNDAHVQVA